MSIELARPTRYEQYPNDQRIIMFCNTDDRAFGPVINRPEGFEDVDVEDYAVAFLAWLPEDARHYGDEALENFLSEFAMSHEVRDFEIVEKETVDA